MEPLFWAGNLTSAKSGSIGRVIRTETAGALNRTVSNSSHHSHEKTSSRHDCDGKNKKAFKAASGHLLVSFLDIRLLRVFPSFIYLSLIEHSLCSIIIIIIIIMTLFSCLLCFPRRRSTSILEGTSPKDLKEKLPHSHDCLNSSSDSELELSKHIIKTTTTPLVSDVPLPKTNRALIVSAKRTYALIDNHPFPSLEHENEVIIETKAVGLNPIDWKSVDYNFCMPSFPWVNGREMAGIVEAVGSNVTDFKVGDRVWTSK
jgi:hypothetical protein